MKKKSTKIILKKKLFNKKPCRETLLQSSVLKKKIKKLNSQSAK
jgi:hypothetical protein